MSSEYALGGSKSAGYREGQGMESSPRGAARWARPLLSP